MQTAMKSFDRVADHYDATRAIPHDALAAVTAGIVRALHGVTPTPSVLEIGVGTGRIAVPLAAAGIRIVGIDIAPAMLARLRAKHAELPVSIASALALPFRERAVDAVLFVHLLHLIPDARQALRAAHEVVRPDGLLLYGRTDHSESPRRRAIVGLREIVRELIGLDLSGAWNVKADGAFAEIARDLGARVEETVLARWMEQTTGRQLIDALRRRLFSSTWAIPDEVMPELLERLTPRVEEMLGGLDRSVENEANFTLVSARLPG
jgi:ubiquinone/menaquinone biosynthesis C-methylase UbiE